MRPLSRLFALSALSALVVAPSAMAANSSTATVTPNKGGSLTVAAPVKFGIKATFPDTPSDTTGNLRLQAIQAKLPLPLLFNSIPFKQCDTAGFIASKSCPSATKLGTATILADGGPSVGVITAKAILYFGSGFQILTRVQTDKPAILDVAVVGQLRSSGTTGYGLEMYIPVPKEIQEPLDDLFPTVKSMDATVSAPVKSVKIDGKKVKLPLAGLGPCPSSKKLNFLINMVYENGTRVVTKTDSAPSVAKCKN